MAHFHLSEDDIYRKPTHFVLDGYEMCLAKMDAELAEHNKRMAEQKLKTDMQK